MKKEIVSIANCKIGDVLAEGIDVNGFKLVSKETELNDFLIKKLVEFGITKLCIYRPEIDRRRGGSNSNFQQVENCYKKSVKSVKNILEDIAAGKKLNYEKLSEIAESINETINSNSSVFQCIHQIRNFDYYTYMHSVNTALYGMLIGKWMGLPQKDISNLIKAGLLHDIGKSRVASEILNKPGKLTDEEFKEMRKHTVYGYSIIKDNRQIDERIKRAVLMHHERSDGSGYPLGIDISSIDLYAKIISIADVFDAMTSNRVYKGRATPFDAFKFFKSEGLRYFDLRILDIFLKHLPSYYIGINVQLNDGMTGEVVYIPPQDSTSPIIRVDNEYVDLLRNNKLKITSVI